MPTLAQRTKYRDTVKHGPIILCVCKVSYCFFALVFAFRSSREVSQWWDIVRLPRNTRHVHVTSGLRSLRYRLVCMCMATVEPAVFCYGSLPRVPLYLYYYYALLPYINDVQFSSSPSSASWARTPRLDRRWIGRTLCGRTQTLSYRFIECCSCVISCIGWTR